MEFWTWGPFEYRSGFSKSDFWATVAEGTANWGYDERALRSAIGCYMFSTSKRAKETPWYIGKTIANTGFYGEIFTPHKIAHYENALDLSGAESANITLFSLVRPDQTLSYAGRTNRRLIDWLEKSLIGMALSKNKNLLNIRDTLYLKNVIVEGVIGTQRKGRPYEGARVASRALR